MREAEAFEIIWLGNAAFIKRAAEFQHPGIPVAEPPELRSRSRSFLLFDYDEARNKAAWRTLGPKWPTDLLEITVVGQFEARLPRASDPSTGMLDLGAPERTHSGGRPAE